MSKAIFCIANFPQAERIVERLKSAGFANDDISVIMADQTGTRDFAHERNTKAPEGAIAGVGTGAVVGGTIGWLAGIGTLAIPGLGALIAAGPVLALLSGAAVGGTVGGITGALIGMGIPEFEAQQYEGKIKAGNVLIAVHAEDSDESHRAAQIFEVEGAADISSKHEAAVGQNVG